MSRWLMEDALLAYHARAREDARRRYELDVLVWAIQSTVAAKRLQAPKLPRILREDP